MYSKGLVGHANIDFVSFYDDYNQRQRLWAVDLNIGMSRSQIVFTLSNFLLQGQVETASGEYMIKPMAVEELPSALLDGGSSINSMSSSGGGSKSNSDVISSLPSEIRNYVALDCIYHPNLGAMQYGAFFNLCRLHGVSQYCQYPSIFAMLILTLFFSFLFLLHRCPLICNKEQVQHLC